MPASVWLLCRQRLRHISHFSNRRIGGKDPSSAVGVLFRGSLRVLPLIDDFVLPLCERSGDVANRNIVVILSGSTYGYTASFPVFPNRQHLLYIGLQMLFRNFCLTDNPDKCSHAILLSLLHKNMASLYYKTMLTKITCFQEKARDFIIWECSMFPDFFEYGGALVCR